jgi:hypothetical protein
MVTALEEVQPVESDLTDGFHSFDGVGLLENEGRTGLAELR